MKEIVNNDVTEDRLYHDNIKTLYLVEVSSYKMF